MKKRNGVLELKLYELRIMKTIEDLNAKSPNGCALCDVGLIWLIKLEEGFKTTMKVYKLPRWRSSQHDGESGPIIKRPTTTITPLRRRSSRHGPGSKASVSHITSPPPTTETNNTLNTDSTDDEIAKRSLKKRRGSGVRLWK
ncbi:hypothetical protein ACFE04_022702 [Oxalis oulophora]